MGCFYTTYIRVQKLPLSLNGGNDAGPKSFVADNLGKLLCNTPVSVSPVLAEMVSRVRLFLLVFGGPIIPN